MRKTRYLLESLVRQKKSVTYYALDLSEKSLVESLSPLASNFPSIKFVGLLGTYDDSLAYIRERVPDTHPITGLPVSRTLLWFGSSIGNYSRCFIFVCFFVFLLVSSSFFAIIGDTLLKKKVFGFKSSSIPPKPARTEAASFLAKVRREATRVGDMFLCGIDRRNDPQTVKLAYDDPKGITREFCLNGLDHVDRILSDGQSNSKKIIDRSLFEYVSVYNEVLGRHEAYYRSKEAQKIVIPASKSLSRPEDVVIDLEEGELINVECKNQVLMMSKKSIS